MIKSRWLAIAGASVVCCTVSWMANAQGPTFAVYCRGPLVTFRADGGKTITTPFKWAKEGATKANPGAGECARPEAPPQAPDKAGDAGTLIGNLGPFDNLPVETMKKFCQGRVCAVDVSEQVEFTSKLSESYTVSGWKLLWQQLSPFSDKPDIPNILNTLYRTTTVGGIRAIASAKAQADLCFEPPVGQFNVFEWRSVDKIIEVGYRYALRKLDESGHPGVD